MDPLTIAHVLPPNSPVTITRGGAVERIVLSIADGQARLGHHVRVYSANEPQTHTRESGLIVESVPVKLPRPFSDIEYLRKVRKRLRILRPDILHANSSPLAAGLVGDAGQVNLATLNFFRFRGSGSKFGRSVYRRFLNRFAAVSSITQFSAQSTAEYFDLPEVPEVLHCGVNLAEFRSDVPIDWALLPEVMQRGRVALYVGRINEQKGAHLLEPLAEALASSGITVVAAGPLGQFHLDGTVEGSTLLGPLVHYLGAVEQEILPALMAAADVLVLPTTADEMFGMVLIEAGACGTPAVASDLGGIPEVVGNAGLLFPVGSVPDMVACVTRLLDDPEELARLSELARRNAERFGWSRIVEQSIRMYRRELLVSS